MLLDVTDFVSSMAQADGKPEETFAQKRAALMEKRMRREKESQQKKMQQEPELDQKKEEARYVLTHLENKSHFHSEHTGIGAQCGILFSLILQKLNCIIHH